MLLMSSRALLVVCIACLLACASIFVAFTTLARRPVKTPPDATMANQVRLLQAQVSDRKQRLAELQEKVDELPAANTKVGGSAHANFTPTGPDLVALAR